MDAGWQGAERRRGGPRRESGGHVDEGAVGGVVGDTTARAGRGADTTAPRNGDVRGAGVATAGRGGGARPRARRACVVAERDRAMAGGGRGAPAPNGAVAGGVRTSPGF